MRMGAGGSLKERFVGKRLELGTEELMMMLLVVVVVAAALLVLVRVSS